MMRFTLGRFPRSRGGLRLLLAGLWGATVGCSALLGFDKDVEEQSSTRPGSPDGGNDVDGSDSKADANTNDPPDILGELDPTFGDGGATRAPLLMSNGASWAKDTESHCGAALDRTGGTFVACATPLEYSATDGVYGGARTRVFRLDAAGKVDPSFGATVDGGPTAAVTASSLAVSADGRVLAVGYNPSAGGASSTGKTVLVRFNADGTLDGTIGGEGVATPALSPDGGRDRGLAIAIAGDKALVAGQRSIEGDSAFVIEVPYLATIALADGAVERVLDGRDPPASDFVPSGILRPANGRSVLYGAAKNADYNDRYPKLVGYVDDGLDPSFGDAGAIQLPDVLRTGMSLLLRAAYDERSGGRIVLGLGPTTSASFQEIPSYLARCTSDGRLDSAFGDAGLRSISLPKAIEPPLIVRPSAIAIAASGKILAAGDVIVSTGRRRAFVARFHANGELDESFGSGGYALPLIFSGADERFDALLLQPDGRVVVVGRALTNEGTWELVALRYR